MNLALPTSDVLDVLCPMHMVLDASGTILHAGPTIRKLRPDMTFEGQAFGDVFEVLRPRGTDALTDITGAARHKLHLALRGQPPAHLKGVMVWSGRDRIVLDLSFGISIQQGVRDYRLSAGDFAATDLAIEMLYLIEAQSAAMEASRSLNLRLQGAKTAAEEQAFTDTLTGLKNRRALDQVLERLLASDASFAVMHIDLDYFKAVNDTLGHAAGDHVLRQVAAVMLEETRKTDLVARVGGDEFTVVLPAVRDIAVLERVGARIIQRIEEPVVFGAHTCEISASIGTAWVQNGDAVSREDVLEEADIALYASKHKGRAQQTFYSPELRETANLPDAPEGQAARGDKL
ncbi:diguanylate cyclase [Sulfitobacter albidus]|uniref:Diguanylate cyclase n=1 Tax=Sulfitobacter albidus TaxID=2829501 RepID=A0A975PLI7_9RHOB|nr:GGDEF domain-containing protein [Sulfitobacter albidus]QUJ75230.1 diguanylate cyclase [Sulfitobacter albidus]